MDEKIFLRELSKASAGLTGNIGDIRDGVWRRIEESRRGEDSTSDVEERRWIVRLDIAAAIVIGCGVLYGWAVDMWSDMYWSGSFYMFNQYFQ